MLLLSTEDGLTVGNRVMVKGDIFALPAILTSGIDVGGDDTALARSQIRMYKKVFYRKATLVEIAEKFKLDPSLASSMTSDERKMVAVYNYKRKKAAEDYMAQLNVNPEEIKAMVEGANKPVPVVEEQEKSELVEVADAEEPVVPIIKATTPKRKPATKKRKTAGGRK